MAIEEPDDAPICPQCEGSGEGRSDGTTCWLCKGRGVERKAVDDDEWVGMSWERDDVF